MKVVNHSDMMKEYVKAVTKNINKNIVPDKIDLIISGGAFVLPIIHNITQVGMRTLCIEVKRSGDKSLITSDRMRAELLAEFFVRVAPEKKSVSIA